MGEGYDLYDEMNPLRLTGANRDSAQRRSGPAGGGREQCGPLDDGRDDCRSGEVAPASEVAPVSEVAAAGLPGGNGPLRAPSLPDTAVFDRAVLDALLAQPAGINPEADVDQPAGFKVNVLIVLIAMAAVAAVAVAVGFATW